MLKAYYQISKYSSNNKLIIKGRKKISRSFVSAFIKHLYCVFYYSNTYSIADTLGTLRTVQYDALPLCMAPSGGIVISYPYTNSVGTQGQNFGIVLGSGTAAVIPTDDNLQTKINHGTAAGEIEYLGHIFPKDVTTSGSDASFTIERLFLNSSGGDVTINEMGLYNASQTGDVYIYCFIRDLVSPAVVVANGEYLKVTYTIQVTC